MKQVLLILCLISIIIVFTKAAPQTNFKDLKKMSDQIAAKNKNSKSSQTNTKPIQSKTQKKEKSTFKNLKETQLQIMNVLKPLFGLRTKDQNRDENGKVTNPNTTEDNKPQNKTNKKTSKNKGNDRFIFQWDQKMGDFEPEFILSFDLDPGSIEVFYEEILKPTSIKGAFFIPQFKVEDKIDFFIKTSNNTLIYSKEKVNEAIFNIDILEKGEYKFIFQNKRSKYSKTVTFTLDVHDSEQEFLKMADLDPLALRVERILMAMKDNYFFDKIAGQQFEGNLEEIQNSNSKLLLFSLIEILGVIFITIWQVFYLKRIVGNQRIF
ncbi:unnamed protein product (macronuclear) [Paramecium tetraurelia]|uniref:GOLD domain-containing protein n=1 Tax=Paramecium tetraurelia TaxID=5888 RepID=A0E7Q6_PARTE|nr:uncharacterized protein GSPATT00024051001 [Paramecium tetraurelia]CAK91323.1 unnamed protein product [Paramecium tetraurelia]|eukprot:XP_001458720.1 hypothetical protein (macronuclear) [Paramecium tetraurelia strain d4-2]